MHSKNEPADVERLIADLSAMVAIRSQSPWFDPPRLGFREREMADWLLAEMTALGLDCHEVEVAPDRPNVWGYRRGSGGGPTLMLCAHMDTVGVEGYQGDPFQPVVNDGRLHGRGSCDMKGAIASFLETVRLLKSVELKGDLLLLFVSDEEHGMTGSAYAGEHGPTADFVVVGEPTKLEVCPKHKGEYCGKISVQGRSAHTSMPENGRNAILDTVEIIQRLDAYNNELKVRPPHDLCGTGRCTVSTIQGGNEVSSVPDHCEIEMDRRTLPGETKAMLEVELSQIIVDAANARPGLVATLDANTLFIPALDTELDASIMQAATKAILATLGEEAQITSFPGCTDGPNLQIPAIILGPGDLARAHTIDEWIEIADLPKAAEIYRHMAISLLE